MDMFLLSIKEALQRSIRAKQVATAYCFSGGAYEDRSALIAWFCDELGAKEIIPLGSRKEKDQSATIDDVRTVLSYISRTSFHQGLRIILCDDADTLTRSAGNALLKAVEEPPSSTTTIFSCQNEKNILATIISRCVCIRFPHCLPTLLSLDEQRYRQWRDEIHLRLAEQLRSRNAESVNFSQADIERFIHETLQDQQADNEERRYCIAFAQALGDLYNAPALAGSRNWYDRLICKKS